MMAEQKFKTRAARRRISKLKSRNLVALDIFTSKYKQQIVPNKKKKIVPEIVIDETGH